MSNIVELKTNGVVKTKEGREFTRLMGGFGENKPMFTIWQAGELLGLGARDITRNFERNIEVFETDIDFVDLKSAVPERDSDKSIEITTFLKNVGYSQNKLNATKQWLAFSFSGMMKLVKIATTDESWEIYDRFLEDYFQTKAENLVMKKTIAEEIEELKRQKAFFIGMGAMETDPIKQIELFREMENVNHRIIKLEKTLTQKQTIEELQPQLHIAETVGNIRGYYDMGDFAKILGINDLGRNNMFKWLRSKKILMADNVPYQHYVKYFKVVPTVAKNGYKSNKTLLRPNGIEYIVKKLIEDGRVVTRTVDEIIAELEIVAS